MHRPSILGIGAWMFAGAVIFTAGKGAAEFQPCLGRFGTVMVHFQACLADRNLIFSNGKIIFVCYFNAPLFIQVDEGLDMVLSAVSIIC